MTYSHETDAYPVPFDMERLVTDAVAEALRHEDADRFHRWLRTRIEDYYTGPLDHPQEDLFPPSGDQVGDPRELSLEVLRTLAFALGRAIWNAMPLPGNGFRPNPLPEPGRNSPCPCGSGRRYEQCCARRPLLPGLEDETMTTLVLQRLPAPILEEAVSPGQISGDRFRGSERQLSGAEQTAQGRGSAGAALRGNGSQGRRDP